MAQKGRSPPLNSLRVFETAARYLSFAKAADELGVTPAAISLQIKSLEDQLSLPLFERLNRTLRLTDSGQSLLPPLRQALGQIDGAIRDLYRDNWPQTLTVSVTPSFAAKWLVHRLDSFHKLHPDIAVRIDASVAVTDFNRQDVDIAIRYGSGKYQGFHVEHFLGLEVFPVCSPSIISTENPLKTPGHLKHHVLLHDINSENNHSLPSWPMWLMAAGVSNMDLRNGARFSNTYLAIEAAIAGKGVALGPSSLVAADIAAGRLIAPLDIKLPVDFAYYFVCLPTAIERQTVKAFRDWVMREALIS